MVSPEDQEKTTFTCPYGTFAFKRMSFGLCNAPTTFQRCMTAIFSDLTENIKEVFIDDFSVYGCSFDNFLTNIEVVLQRCQEKNMVLNWEKCYFMVQEGFVLGHLISSKGLEVDKAKIATIQTLTPPTSVRGVRSFLGQAVKDARAPVLNPTDPTQSTNRIRDAVLSFTNPDIIFFLNKTHFKYSFVKDNYPYIYIYITLT